MPSILTFITKLFQGPNKVVLHIMNSGLSIIILVALIYSIQCHDNNVSCSDDIIRLQLVTIFMFFSYWITDVLFCSYGEYRSLDTSSLMGFKETMGLYFEGLCKVKGVEHKLRIYKNMYTISDNPMQLELVRLQDIDFD